MVGDAKPLKSNGAGTSVSQDHQELTLSDDDDG
jgi:hypothetical protein